LPVVIIVRDGVRFVLANLDMPRYAAAVENCKDARAALAHDYASISDSNRRFDRLRYKSLPLTNDTRPAATVSGAPPLRIVAQASAGAIAALGVADAQASLFTGDTLDAVANGIAWAVLVLVPIIGITVFWLVHVLPEKIAHKRHHPQTKAIQTLCLLSLVFGGLLWPIAWLWAYTKPVAHKAAYGTDKADEFFDEAGEKARAGQLLDDELAHLTQELDAMQARGALPAKLIKLREDLATLQPPAAAVQPQPVQAERRSA
jgi:hypothetical protein